MHMESENLVQNADVLTWYSFKASLTAPHIQHLIMQQHMYINPNPNSSLVIGAAYG